MPAKILVIDFLLLSSHLTWFEEAFPDDSMWCGFGLGDRRNVLLSCSGDKLQQHGTAVSLNRIID